jgi:hypothetical protein
VISEKKNEELFQIDTKGSEKMKKVVRSTQPKPLRLDQIVKPQSKINVPPQRLRPKVEKTLLKKKLQALKNAPAVLPQKKAAQQDPAIKDVWADEVVEASKKSVNKNPEVKVKAVKVPAPGASYNPDPVAHEELMQIAAEQELARLAKQERIKAALDVPLAPRPDTVNYDETTGMIYEDILGPGEESAEEASMDNAADNEFRAAINTAQKRKSKAEKRREADAKAAELAKKSAEIDRQLAAQALQAKTIAKTIKKESQQKAKEQALKASLKKVKQSKREGRKIGPMRFMPSMIPVQLPEELSNGSLRALKPEGNLLEDRFKSLQEQAKIEPRVRRALKKNKFALKTYEKHSYKSFK